MTPIPVPPAPSAPLSPMPGGQQNLKLLKAAQDLEATFLSEMLKAMKFDTVAGGFGSNQGAEQFGSFLRDAQAEKLVQAGGIGLAEALFNAMMARADA
ncbi:chemotaxis protein chel [Salipiger sp. IMCC34102]|uniref:rod-binding protein n=1 Tax=Salipiger sp. IMCC34102 TaxID=2510647 RepID=UPI00101C1C4B|nr:rod-binding protein [Salipiger sp. IMCC34102]RYH01579.1 chemotaxis protein chel [Salipiger sp. IMCC34102]